MATIEELKKAFSEGAKIEYRKLNKLCSWEDILERPNWLSDYAYRIKGDISFESWNAHKETIKAFWDGAKIEYRNIVLEADWVTINNTSNWLCAHDDEYRIKGGISIESWDVHKELIMLWWGGYKINFFDKVADVWRKATTPTWGIDICYRFNAISYVRNCEGVKMADDKDVMGRQVGGDHYKKSVQPWDIIDTYKLNFYEGNALKYLLRRKDPKKRVEDLQKAIHYLEKEISNVDM